MASTYIEVPADDLLGELRDIGAAVTKRGGQCEEGVIGREIIFDIHVPAEAHPEHGQTCHLALVRVYTSITKGSSVVRGCGDDAIRIVLGATVQEENDHPGEGQPRKREPKFRPLDKGRRIFRTAPKGSPEERVKAFLARFRQALREAYRAVSDTSICPSCNKAPMATRKTKDGDRQFLGCVRFPECKGTRPLPPTTP